MSETQADASTDGFVSLGQAITMPERQHQLPHLTDADLLFLIQRNKGPSLVLSDGEVRVRKDVFVQWEEDRAHFLKEKAASKPVRWTPALKPNAYACTDLFALVDKA